MQRSLPATRRLGGRVGHGEDLPRSAVLVSEEPKWTS